MDRTGQFLKLFLAHEAEVRAFIGALVRERVAREDVFRDVAVALWEGFDRYDPARPFGAWARSVASNKILQQRRRDAPARSPFRRRPSKRCATPSTGPMFRQANARRPSKSASGGSRSARRKSFRCVTATAPPPRQIASQLHISVDAVYQTLSRLRTQLAECLRRRITSNQVLRG